MRRAPSFTYPGPFIGLKRDVHPSSIGPAYCESVNNVVFRKGRVERRMGFAHIAGDSSRTCPWVTVLEHLIHQTPEPEFLPANYLFGVLSGYETEGSGQVFRVSGFDNVGILAIDVLPNPNNINVPWARAHFARFDDWVLIGGTIDQGTFTLPGSTIERTKMPCFRMPEGPVRELGLTPPTAGPFVGRNWAGAFTVANQNLRQGSTPQYRVHYYDEPNNIESDSETSPAFTEVRTAVTDPLNVWPGVGFNVAFSTTVNRSADFTKKFDQALVIKLQSKSDATVFMIGNVLTDDGVNVVMTSMAEGNPPLGLGNDLEITIAPYPAKTGQRVFIKKPPAGSHATHVRIYRREAGEQFFPLVAQVALSSLTDLGNGWSYYSDTTVAEKRDFKRTSPQYNQQPPAAEVVFNHQDVAVFLGVSGVPRNRVYISQPRNVKESQTGAHYLRTDAYVSLPLKPSELQHLAGASYRGDCIIFTHKAAYAIGGTFVVDENTGTLGVAIRPLDGVHGALNQNLVFVHDGVLYHYDAGGLWAYNGAEDVKISGPIDDYRTDPAYNGSSVITEKRVNTDYWHLHRHSDQRHDWLIMLAAEAERGDELGSGSEFNSRGTTATTIPVVTGLKALTITLERGRIRPGDRLQITNGVDKSVIGECLDFDPGDGSCDMVIKQVRGSGNLSGTNAVFVLPPMPNRAYIFNLDRPRKPHYGEGWTVFKQALTAVCSTLNTSLDSVLVFAGSSADLGGAAPAASSIYGYGRSGFGEKLGATLTDPFENFRYEAIFGSPAIGDMRHPLRFFDLTFQFDDDVNVPDAAEGEPQWIPGDLLVGFIHGNRRFREGPSPLKSAPLIGCLAPTDPHYSLRLRCANYRGAPIITNDQELNAAAEDEEEP